MRIKNFNNFITEKSINESIKHFKSVELNESDNRKVIKVALNMIKSSSINEGIKNEIISELSKVNESFFDKLKERFPKAAEVSSVLSDKAEKTLNSFLQKAKDAVSFVKVITEKVKKFFKEQLSSMTKYITKLIKGDTKFKEKIKEINDKNKEGLISDIKTGREVSKWYKENYISNLSSLINKNTTKFLNSDVQAVSESSINEGGNVIATLVHKIEEFPPFSWLHKVQQAGEAGANKLIEVVSKLTEKMGGPKFELPVIATLLGVLLEQIVKNTTGGGLIDLLGASTPFGMAIKGLKMVALVVAFIVSIDAVVGNKILGSGH